MHPNQSTLLHQQKRSIDFRRDQRLGKLDHLITLQKPQIEPVWMPQEAYDRAAGTRLVRELGTGGKTLVTTMLDSTTASKTDLEIFYRDRWHIELDLRHIKTTLGMDVLSCRTPELMEKEIWVYLLAYNFIRVLMAQSALLADILPRQLSFKRTLQL
jgi:IS4 transposase